VRAGPGAGLDIRWRLHRGRRQRGWVAEETWCLLTGPKDAECGTNPRPAEADGCEKRSRSGDCGTFFLVGERFRLRPGSLALHRGPVLACWQSRYARPMNSDACRVPIAGLQLL